MQSVKPGKIVADTTRAIGKKEMPSTSSDVDGVSAHDAASMRRRRVAAS